MIPGLLPAVWQQLLQKWMNCQKITHLNFSVNLAANAFHALVCFVAFHYFDADYLGGAWCVSATRCFTLAVMVFLIRRGRLHEATWPAWEWRETVREWGAFVGLGASGAVMVMVR